MADALVIVESPAKAKTIGKFLGSKYIVKASVGHVRDLPKSKLGIEVEQGYLPQYITVRGKGDIIKALKTASKKVKQIYFAADHDREGEAIAWHLAHVLKVDEDAKCRIVFNEITKQAIKDAVKEPRQIDLRSGSCPTGSTHLGSFGRLWDQPIVVEKGEERLERWTRTISCR